MFKKQGEGNITSLLSSNTQFKGVITFKGSIRIDGKFEGEVITGDTLFIGESGDVKAKIKAGNVIIGGRLVGDVETKDTVELLSTSVVEGNLKTSKLIVAGGAAFNGRCDMEGGNPRSETISDSLRRIYSQVGGVKRYQPSTDHITTTSGDNGGKK